jgi:transcriptional regulator with XRE-family HTH domain/tetratricopeptide (TPR) repeat protein
MKKQDTHPNEKLKREREIRGWSQRTVATHVGTAEQVVARWEGGRHKPNRYFQTQLCELFGKNAEELGFLLPASDTLAREASIQEAIKDVASLASTTEGEAPFIQRREDERTVYRDECFCHVNYFHFAAWSTLLQENSESLAKAHESVSAFLDVEIIVMALQWRLSSDSLVLLQQLTYESIRKYDAMHKDHFDQNSIVTRRHALQAIATFPIQMYNLTHPRTDVRPMPLNELLPSCAAGIAACLELRRYESDGLFTLQRILSAYLPLLEYVIRQFSSYQSVAAYLASQGYLLVNIIAEHYGKMEQMEAAARQARLYGKIAQDVNLEVSALIRLAIKFDYEHNDMKALEIYQEALALPGFSTVSPLLRGRVYAGLAGTHAYCSQTAQALSFLSQAKEIYPNEPESDPAYPFAMCDGNTLALYEGLTLKHTDNCADAFSAFARFGTLTPFPGLLELNRVEHLNYAASVAILQRDLDAAALYLDVAVDVAWQIQDATRQSEVRDSLRSMRLLWPNEAKVKTVQEKLSARQRSSN